jgi:hypothetical protein
MQRQPQKTFKFKVNVLLLREDNAWVAQCLDFDISAHGRSIHDAKSAFGRVFIGQILLDIQHGRKPLQDVPKAPARYRTLFNHAERLKDAYLLKVPRSVPPAFIINAVAGDLRINA